MSSTNRGSKRIANDCYETPEWTTQLLLNHIDKLEEPILEPAVGRGKIASVLVDNRYNDITGIDINPDFNPAICCDYLTWDKDKDYNTIITNPPFIYAQEYIEKSLSIVNDGGLVILLLRLNFLESRKRFGFWEENKPTFIYVLAERPSFFGNKTDSTSYAWYVWEKGNKNNISILDIISKSELNE